MHYIGLGLILVIVIIWGIFDYYTEVKDDVPRWIRRALWGPGFAYCFTMTQMFPLLSFSSGPVKKMALTYCFLLVLISIPSLYCGQWAIESYNRQLKRKSIIISVTNWVFGLCVSLFIFHFVITSQNAGL